MGWLSNFFDNVVGLDPNGGGIYNTANNLLGDTVGDDILGFDPNGGGSVPFLNKAIPIAASYALGDYTGGLASGAGWGSTAAGTIGGATAGAANSAFSGQDPLKGALYGGLSGGVAGGISQYNPAQYVGIDSPGLAKMFNTGVSGTANNLLRGNSASDAFKSGLYGSAVSGLNSAGSFVSSMMDQFGGDEFGDLPGNMVTGDDPYNATPEMYSDEGGRFDNSAGFSYAAPQAMSDYENGSSVPTPDVQALSFSPMSFSAPSLSSIGNFAGNNLGELATSLYGVYNNRRQQKAIKDQMNQMQDWYNKNSQTNQTAMKTLEDLYSNNSPYATQLRNKITAQAAASGRRSNLSGRETQLQAALADKYASILPQLTSMQNEQNRMGSALAQANLQAQAQRGLLQNRMMGNLLNMGNQTGAFKNLGSLFTNGTQTIPYNYGNVSGSDMFGYKGAGGF